MKHMKRALSLVLAMVMLLGMFVVPTGAAGNFADAEEITYNEAVEITSGIGLFAGSDGKFMPKGTVTRAQMATIIVKMLHGADANADSFKGANGGFTDTASFEGGWAEGYINWCASLGVVAGYGDGTFRPGQAVTTAEAVTMILNALKVNAGEGQWPLTVMSKAEELKFFQELDTKPETNQALNREELAVIAFAGLEYSPEGKNEYICNGVTYDSYMAAYLAAGRDATKVETVKAGSLSSKVYGLKSVSGFITGNQALGLECTELQTVVEGNVATYQFDIESDQTAIGHYVTVYYDELYVSEVKPGKTYTIFDEGVVVEVTEDIDSRNDFRAAFGTGKVELATGAVCVVDSAYSVKTGYPRSNGFASGDVTFVTGDTYNVAAGTYVVNEKEVVAYIAPPVVYASVVDAMMSYQGNDTITLRGANNGNGIPNNPDNDLITEILAMEVDDYVTYTMVGERYLLERVRVVTGKVSSLSKTKINGVDYDTVTVDGVDYVEFNGVRADNLGLSTSVSELNYTDTYDFYVTRDDKFVGFKTSDGGLNLDNLVYILGVIKTAKKDTYGDQIIHFTARGVDMNGTEALVSLAQVKDANRNGEVDDGEELLGDASIVGTYGSFASGFYTVKDHTDSKARKEDIKTLVGFARRYDEQTSPVFTSEYIAGSDGLSFSGSGSYNCGYCTTQNSTRVLVLEGSLNSATPLTAMVSGPKSVILDDSHASGKPNQPRALISMPDGNVRMVEVLVVPVDSASVSANEQRVYISKDKTESVGSNATGYVYDVYNVFNGAETQITMKDNLVLTPGFYRVTMDNETQQYSFLDTTRTPGGRIPQVCSNFDQLTQDSARSPDQNDGVTSSNVLYDQVFDYIYNSMLYTTTGFEKMNISSVVVVDTRSEDEMDATMIDRVTSMEQLTSLKKSNKNLVIKFDLWFNSGTDKVTSLYITDIGDPSSDTRNGSLLYSADCETFTVVETTDADKLPVGGTYTLEAGQGLSVSGTCLNACTHKNGFFIFNGATASTVQVQHLNTEDSEGKYGIHNVVIRADGNEFVSADAHISTSACSSYCYNWNATTANEASMVLNLSNNSIPVYDMANTGIASVAALKSAVTASLANRAAQDKIVISYYCKDGYGDQTPEAIFVESNTGSALRSSTSTQPVWRVKAGEWVFNLAGTGITVANRNNGGLDSRSLTVYGDGALKRYAGSGGVFLQIGEVSGVPSGSANGAGLYIAQANEYGRTTLVYQAPVEITEIRSDATLLNLPSGGNIYTETGVLDGMSTLNDIIALLNARQSKIMGNKVYADNKEYVYIYSVEAVLHEVALNDGDTIIIANDFDADAGYVEATVVDSSVTGAYEGWKIMAKFDAATATTPGDYKVSVSGGVITLNKLQTETVEDLNAVGAGDEITFASGVYAGYKSESWLRSNISDPMVVVKAKKTTVGSEVSVEIQSITYKVTEGVVLYMANEPANYNGTGNGEFIVVDPKDTGLTKGATYFFGFNKNYFYATTDNTATARVFCYGWKEGYLLTSDSRGVRTGTSQYLDKSGALGAFSHTGSMWAASFAYHRKATSYVTNNNGTYSITVLRANTDVSGSSSSNSHNCGHSQIGSCYLPGTSNNKTVFNFTADTVIIDARNGGSKLLTPDQFQEEIRLSFDVGFTKAKRATMNIFTEPYGSDFSTQVRYLVLIDPIAL